MRASSRIRRDMEIQTIGIGRVVSDPLQNPAIGTARQELDIRKLTCSDIISVNIDEILFIATTEELA